MDGRDHVLPDDVQQLGVPVLAHRLLPSTESRLSGRSTSDIVTDILDRIPLPVGGGHGALAPRDRLMRLRPTPRGWALGVAGLVALQLGVVLGAVDLVRIGTLALLLVVGAAVGVGLLDPGRGKHRLSVQRRATPEPRARGRRGADRGHDRRDRPGRARPAGRPEVRRAGRHRALRRSPAARARRPRRRAAVTVTLRGAGGTPRALAARPARRDPQRPVRRGPHVRDARRAGRGVGLAGGRRPCRRPATSWSASPTASRSARARPSTDDASLRDYREGDDLRRVHWSSSARKGALMVRSDERAGMRPVSVLLDLPARVGQPRVVDLARRVDVAGHARRRAPRAAGERPARGRAPCTRWRSCTTAPGPAPATPCSTARSTSRRPAPPRRARRSSSPPRTCCRRTDAGGEIVLAVLGPLGAARARRARPRRRQRPGLGRGPGRHARARDRGRAHRQGAAPGRLARVPRDARRARRRLLAATAGVGA